MRRLKKLLYYAFNTFILAVASVSIYFIFCRTIKHQDFPKLFGMSAAIVASDSMSPTIVKGDAIIIKECEQYYLGDIVTYQDKTNYVTHRIVEVDGDSFVTKGDSNNVNDANPVQLGTIYGKVILTVPTLNRLPNNEQIYIVLLIIVVLVMFSNDFVNVFRNKKISLKGLLVKFMCVLIFFCTITFSKYTNDIAGDDEAHTATFFIDGEEVTQNISFSDWAPGSSHSYNIIIKNFNGSATANTAQQYHLILKKEGTLPLIYSLRSKNNNEDGVGSMLENKEISFEGNVGILDGGVIPADKAISHEYILDISWPKEENVSDLSSQSEEISITVESVQLDSLN